MSKSGMFVGIAISFAAGVFLASAAAFSRYYLFAAAAILVAVFAFTFVFAKNRLAPVVALFLVAAVFGAWRLQAAQKPNEYREAFGQKQKLEGYIVEDVDIRTNFQMLTFRPKGRDQKILITTTKTGEYFYGDWIVAEGKVTQPEAFDDFNYPKYLERYDVYALMKYPKILVLKNHQGNMFKDWLLQVKYAFIGRINIVLKEPKSSLLLGILIGARKSLPQNVTDDFTTVGLSHVVAVSGYNISIIIGALGGLLAKLFGRKASLWLSLLIIAGFVVIAGASASVIRAALMGLLLLLSFRFGRLYAITPSLCFAAFLMLLLNPKILYWDVGFQLSFLATMGIIYFVPVLERLTDGWPNPLNTKSILLTTMAAMVATLPLIMFNFGRLSTVAPLVNILVLPIIPEAMLFGFLSFLPFFGPGFALITDVILTYILTVSARFARLPYASLEVEISVWIFVLLIGVVLLAYFLLKRLSFRHRIETANVDLPRFL